MQALSSTARQTNPLFSSPHRLKLGIFGVNASGAGAISTVEGRFEPTWPNVLELANMADDAGMEAIVPVGRWRGFGGVTDFNGSCYETFTWAAGVGAATHAASVFATCHMPAFHPIVAAKQATTIDHITNGRFTLNLVCGWFSREMEMFGAPIMEHELRYDYGEEWIAVAKMLWAGEPDFSFNGKFFKINKGFHEPKPIQRPFPPLMQAGGSPRGRDFAAKHADVAFIGLGPDLDEAKADIENLRKLAREKYGRELQVWTTSYGVVDDSNEQAEAFLKHYVEDLGDWEAATNMITELGIQTEILTPEVLESIKYHFVAGWAGYPLVGTPETVAERMRLLPEIGVDGTLLVFARYRQDLRRFIDEVMPRLREIGLRQAELRDPSLR
jgi:alkanesulfonate monooxygenase SsuD/methylene tetrahydromethanopterin reductase-like flavin-dependent oxidoreductase (luciferase family)